MIGECDFCGYETSLTKYKNNAERKELEKADLCDICASTLAGNAYHWPKQYDCIPLMKQMSYIGNVILDAVNSLKKSLNNKDEKI